MKKLLGFATAIALLAGIVMLFGISRFDAAAVRERLEAGLAAATGRPWSIAGDVRLVPGTRPTVEVRGLRTPNTRWAAEADFIRIEHLRFETGWWGLLRGAPRVSRVLLGDVAVNLETDGEGGNNWSLPGAVRRGPGTAVSVPPGLQRVRIERTRVRFRSGWAEAETSYPIASIVLELHGDATPLALAFDARVNEGELSGSGKLGSPATMLRGEPFEIALSGRYSGRESTADIAVAGRVERLAGLEGLELTFTLKADSLNDVGSIAGYALPRDTPVSITAVAVNEGAGPQLRDYVLRIGQAILRPQD